MVSMAHTLNTVHSPSHLTVCLESLRETDRDRKKEKKEVELEGVVRLDEFLCSDLLLIGFASQHFATGLRLWPTELVTEAGHRPAGNPRFGNWAKPSAKEGDTRMLCNVNLGESFETLPDPWRL
jgi:hypothetical protein